MQELMLLTRCNAMTNRLKKTLQKAGYSCFVPENAGEACEMIDNGWTPLVVLDATMTWKSISPLLESMREHGITVLFIASEASAVQHLKALYRGRCECVLSEADPPEHLLRMIERLQEKNRFFYGDLCLDVDTRIVSRNGESMALTAQESALLQALMTSPENALSRQDLLEAAWGYQSKGETRTVDVHVQRLRRKLGAAMIETVYRCGYRLKMA